MILPLPRASIGLPTAREQRKTPVRLTSITFCQPASGVSSGDAAQVVPALLTRMSIWLRNARAPLATTASIASRSRVSQASAERLDAGRRRELRRDLLAARPVARAEDDGGARLRQPFRHLPADPGRARR